MLSVILQAPAKELEQWPHIIETASKSPLGMFALMLLLAAVIALAFFRKANARTKLVVFLVMFGSLVMYGAAITRTMNDVYRVRVTVVGPDGIPVDDAHVYSTFGGEAMKVQGGWLFVIPEQTRPADSRMTIYAEVKEAFLRGSEVFNLGKEMNPAVTVHLVNPRDAKVRGRVDDQNGSAIAGVEISVAGFDSEKKVTDSTGDFELPAHATNGEEVQVHAEKKGYRGASLSCPAGNTPCVIVLKRGQPAGQRR